MSESTERDERHLARMQRKKAIIDERLRGSVAKDERGLKNRLDLDLDASRALLPERWLFRRDDPLRLVRVRTQDLPPAVRRQVAEAP